MGASRLQLGVTFLVGLMIFSASICLGITDPRDVYAITSLFEALHFPPLPGWSVTGDPCGENWLGVQCVFSNVTGILLSGANLSGQLGDNLNHFSSIITIDLSNNSIGGHIPSNLPPTVQEFFLSNNKFNGSIPVALASLGSLLNLSFSNNLLTGEMPDAFQQLTGLTSLDLSGNNLSGQLPPSFGSLSSLTTMHLQNNQLTGVLDVLQNLPLTDLNIENNLFSGPIPVNLLRIPNFRKIGNPFNTTVLPSPPVSPPSFSPALTPALPPISPSPSSVYLAPSSSHGIFARKSRSILLRKRIFWLVIGGAFMVIVIALGMLLFASKCGKRRQVIYRTSKEHDAEGQSPTYDNCSLSNQFGKVPREEVLKPQDGYRMDNSKSALATKCQGGKTGNLKKLTSTSSHENDHVIDKTVQSLPPPPHPSSLLHIENSIMKPIKATEISGATHANLKGGSSIRSFTVASLQQITNSFTRENFIGSGTLGSVYRAELPDGKFLAVKKLEAGALGKRNTEEFLQLVSSLSTLKNKNIVELVGYCAEHGERLLVYDYCRNGTLFDALHTDEDIHKKLSWNVRIRIALGAARALEYLHEVCQPPTMHQNFKSANVLLDDELSARTSDCGVAPLASTGSGSKLATYGYGAPECELGSYTHHSDVYSFGVVMLELLTGRKAYDRSRPRGEQLLVRWVIPQLHDIDALSRMVDPILNGAYPFKSLSRFADIISLCVQSEPEFRPPMSEIVQNLLHMIER